MTTIQTASKSRAPLYVLAFTAVLGGLGLGAGHLYIGYAEKMAQISAQKESKPTVAPTTPVQPTQAATPAPAPTKAEAPKPAPATPPPATTADTKKDEKKDDKAPTAKPTTKEPPTKEALPMKDGKLDVDAVVAKVTVFEVTIDDGDEGASLLMRACRPWSFWRNDITNAQELAIARKLNGITEENNDLLPKKKGDKIKLPCEPTEQSKKWAKCQMEKIEKNDLTICNEASR